MSMLEEGLEGTDLFSPIVKKILKIVDISNKKTYNEYTIKDKAIYQKRRSTQARVGIKKVIGGNKKCPLFFST